jgi:prophage DNA circulation protein
MIGAFSLLELMVATAVFVGLALILLSIAGSLSSFWQMGISHNERRSSVLAAFSRMARDLRFAAAPINPASTNFQLVINPTNVGANYRLPQAAFWQAPVASDRTRGDIALVGYFVQWVNETNGSVTNFAPKLCRLLIDSTNFQFQKPSDWINDALIASNAPADKASGYQGQLAENILGIWMQPLDQASRAITNNASNVAYANGEFDSTKGYSAALTNGTTKFAPALPASVAVAVVAVDARTAKRLAGTANERPSPRAADMTNDVTTFYNGLPEGIKRGARIYSTVIDVQTAPR